jgi:hypothetical protein
VHRSAGSGAGRRHAARGLDSGLVADLARPARLSCRFLEADALRSAELKRVSQQPDR